MFSGLRYLGGCLKTWLAHVIASEETPHRQPTFAQLPTNTRPNFVSPPIKRPDEGTTADNTPLCSPATSWLQLGFAP